MDDRFLDKGYSLYQWAERVIVHCPRCRRVGIVKGEKKPVQNFHYGYLAKFTCIECSYSITTDDSNWFKRDICLWQGPVQGVGHRPCAYCGYKWVSHEKIFENVEKIKNLQGKEDCPNCSKTNVINLNFFPHEPWGHAIDPFFGMELALKESTRYGTVWVYNATHLEDLKKFVSAKVRERVMNTHSYFQRLPAWIKSAKNRDMVLKAIGKLESKITTLKDN